MSAPTARLGDIAQFVNGLAFKPADWTEEGAPIIRIQNLTDESKPFNRTVRSVEDKYIVRTGDLLVSWSASLGVFEWKRPSGAVLNQHIFRVIPDTSRVHRPYLRYAIEQALSEMGKHLHGATMQHVNRGDFLSTAVRLPELKEQARIAAILDRADAIRRKRKQAIALTEQLLRSTFLEIFGDPVTNPKAWPVKPLTESCLSKQYGTAEKANEAGDGQPVLRMNNLTYGGEIDLTSLKWVNLPENEASKLDLQDGDILFNRVNSHELVGKTAVWSHGEGYTFAGYLIRLRVHRDEFNPFFVGAAMNMPSMKKLLFAMAKPSINMANISGSDLIRVPIIKPPLPLQNRFQAIVDRVRIMRKSFDAASAAGDACFDALVSSSFR